MKWERRVGHEEIQVSEIEKVAEKGVSSLISQ
jgi:hypothetical protein